MKRNISDIIFFVLIAAFILFLIIVVLGSFIYDTVTLDNICLDKIADDVCKERGYISGEYDNYIICKIDERTDETKVLHYKDSELKGCRK